jgi:hypothetical protein
MRSLVAAGGVERLVDVINDIDDDDVSKKVRQCAHLLIDVGMFPSVIVMLLAPGFCGVGQLR